MHLRGCGVRAWGSVELLALTFPFEGPGASHLVLPQFRQLFRDFPGIWQLFVISMISLAFNGHVCPVRIKRMIFLLFCFIVFEKRKALPGSLGSFICKFGMMAVVRGGKAVLLRINAIPFVNGLEGCRWKMWDKYKEGLLPNGPKNCLVTEPPWFSLFQSWVEWMGSCMFSFWTRTLIRSLRINKVVEVWVKKALLRKKMHVCILWPLTL